MVSAYYREVPLCAVVLCLTAMFKWTRNLKSTSMLLCRERERGQTGSQRMFMGPHLHSPRQCLGLCKMALPVCMSGVVVVPIAANSVSKDSHFIKGATSSSDFRFKRSGHFFNDQDSTNSYLMHFNFCGVLFCGFFIFADFV